MNPTYQKLLAQMKEISALAQVGGLLSWDQETMMPPAAAAARAEQSAAQAGVIHEKFTAPGVGEWLRELAAAPEKLSEDERVCVREWLRDYDKATKLPGELVRELASTASLAQEAWVKARKASDFSAFAPWLAKTIDLKRRQAKAYGYQGSPYDALLDDYEPGATVAKLDPLFEELRRGLVPIAAAIRNSKAAIDATLLMRRYPEAKQEALAREVMGRLGVDENATRLDRSAHPFCAGIASPFDVRLTTRYDERWLPGSLYGVIHESGHALYDLGLDTKHAGTPLAEPVSLGIHESQSRFWENIVGRSRPFLRFLLPRLKRRFPRELRGAGVEALYRAVNRVAPSCIRVEADEVTYNLHVVLRYEIEKGLLAGELAVPELPSLWTEKMKALLGVRPKNNAEGVLQDVHWSSGLVGYFPTYTLGNLCAAQLWSAMRKDIRGAEGRIARGEFAPILSWLHEHIHRHGRRYDSAELIRRATGEEPDARHFLAYLREKFGGIYRIDRW